MTLKNCSWHTWPWYTSVAEKHCSGQHWWVQTAAEFTVSSQDALVQHQSDASHPPHQLQINRLHLTTPTSERRPFVPFRTEPRRKEWLKTVDGGARQLADDGGDGCGRQKTDVAQDFLWSPAINQPPKRGALMVPSPLPGRSDRGAYQQLPQREKSPACGYSRVTDSTTGNFKSSCVSMVVFSK